MYHTCNCTDGQHRALFYGYPTRKNAEAIARHTGRHIVTVGVE